ncbi:hypothetical protein P9112_002547 [Eukaryota sp. TZLM1-RC]
MNDKICIPLIPQQRYSPPVASRLSMQATPSQSAECSRKRPLECLSLKLLHTYKHINSVYYAKKGKQQQKSEYDTPEGDLIFNIGEIFDNRYEIEAKVGQGSFGVVVKAIDIATNVPKAIKIIKNRPAFLEQANVEINILNLLNDNDPDHKNCCVRVERHFFYKHHLCIVFEFLASNLYELLRRGEFNGFSIALVRRFATQILTSLAFLQKLEIIHCDLKPENILLVASDRASVKVIDFGSSCRLGKTLYSYIQSRFYRSPEVLLGLPYGMAIDMWSLGCILVELNTGSPLFYGKNEVDMIVQMIEVLGYPPDSMIEKSPNKLKYFIQNTSKDRSRRWILKEGAERVGTRPLEKVIGLPPHPRKSKNLRDQERERRDPITVTNEYKNFTDLIYRMLSYSASERILPDDALKHAFIYG